MFPTGQAQDAAPLQGSSEARVSVVNVGNPVVFVDASSLGLQSAILTRTPAELDADTALKQVGSSSGALLAASCSESTTS